MSVLSIQPTFPIFTESDGQPLENGFIFVGSANQNPQVNPINVFFDAALTIPAVQPIRTQGGYPVFLGTPARIYVNSDYSIQVKNKNGSVVYSAPAATERYNDVVINIQASSVKYTPLGDNAVDPVFVSDSLDTYVYVAEYTTPEAAAIAAFENNAQMHIQEGDIVKLPCNPTAGDDFQAMCKWISSNHYRSEPQTPADFNVPSTALFLEIADGLHNVETFIDVTDNRVLDIRATGTPDFISITGATFTDIGTDIRPGILYEANITLATALPARVVPGFAVGGQNVQGDGGADCLNGGFIVESVAANRLSLVVEFRGHGVAPTAFTTPDSTPGLSLTPNQLMIPKTTIRAQSSGWGTGASREGFMNAMFGGKIRLTNLGLSYNGISDAHEMLFANGEGSEIRLVDRVVVAGAGNNVIRSGFASAVTANRSCIGGSVYARNVANTAGGTHTFIRTMLNSAWESCVVSIFDGSIDFLLSVGNNTGIGARTTYPSANINIATSRLSRHNNAIQVNRGDVFIDSGTSIRFSTTPIALNGPGTVEGNFVSSDNTNLVVNALEVNANGGIFIPLTGRPKDPQLTNVLVVNKTYVAADFGTIAAHSTIDIASNATDTPTSFFFITTSDDVIIKRTGAGLFQQGLNHRAFVTTSATQGTYKADGTTTVTITMANTFSPGDTVALEFKFNTGSVLTNTTYTVVTASATEFTITHATAVQGEGRVSRDNGIITLRVDNLTTSTFSPVDVTIRLAVLKILTP